MWIGKDLKEKARAAFKANYWYCVIAALILSILIGGSVSIASSVGSGRSRALPKTTGQTTNQNGDRAAEQIRSSGILNINGVEIELKNIDGAGISKALDAVSEGLKDGKLNINGEDIDVKDAETVEKLQKAITELQDADLSQYSHDDIKTGASAILAFLGGILLICVIIGCLLRIFLFNPLAVGCKGFFMINSREKAELGEIKRGFSPSWIHNVGAMLLKDIFLFLWSLLFLIPGIIKAYSYAMVPFILADDPSLGAREAITLSRKMMDGNKWRAFVLDLSFIGWVFLSICTLGILGIFYVNPYIYSTHAELYNALKNRTEQ